MRTLWLLLALSAPALHADVTVRYTMATHFVSFLPAGTLPEMAGAQNPTATSTQVKGTKGHAAYGKFDTIVDTATGQMTVLESASKTYATGTLQQFADKMTHIAPEMPAAARQMMASMKSNFESKATGRTETIHGIQGEEVDGLLTVDGPAMPGMQISGPMMKMMIRIWTAKPGELQRVAGLKELAAFKQSSSLGDASEITKMLGTVPGVGQATLNMVQEFQNKGVLLRMHMEIQMPFMAQVAEQMAKAGRPMPAGFDPNQPFATIDQELTDLSTAPIDDSVLRVPEGYKEVPMDEIVKSIMAAQPGAAKQ